MKINYTGKSNIGYKRRVNEDWVDSMTLGTMEIMAIADGAGSIINSYNRGKGKEPEPGQEWLNEKESLETEIYNPTVQPAIIAIKEIFSFLSDWYKKDKKLFEENLETILEMSLAHANTVLGSFRIANEELYSGIMVSLSIVIIKDSGDFVFAHCGNTRIYLMRESYIESETNNVRVSQLTTDHTLAQTKVDKNELEQEQYYLSKDRLTLTSCLGIFANPEIQTFAGRLKNNDILFMSTKGIHFALRPEAILDISLSAHKFEIAIDKLIEAAKEQRYIDNMTCMFIKCSE